MLSPGLLRKALPKAKTTPKLRETLSKCLEFGCLHWKKFERVGEPIPCRATRDPVLLALRRLAWPELGELSAMHRWAVEQAAKRPYGFLHLVLEEVVALEHPAPPPAVEEDGAFGIFLELFKMNTSFSHPKELADLQARCLLQLARRHLALGDDCFIAFLLVASKLVREGSGDLELTVFLAETFAMAAESKGREAEAISLRLGGMDALCGAEAFVFSLVDRLAEATIDAAELMRRHDAASPDASFLYEQASHLLDQLAPTLNHPLRRRLALHC